LGALFLPEHCFIRCGVKSPGDNLRNGFEHLKEILVIAQVDPRHCPRPSTIMQHIKIDPADQQSHHRFVAERY